jgi:hypothetical protein
MSKVHLLPAKISFALAAALLLCLAARGQTIIENFPGLNFTTVSGLGSSSTPPDTMGAAGTNQPTFFRLKK